MRILIVEDDRTTAMILSHVANSNGFSEVEIVESGEEALEKVVHENYNLITLDILLPGASGLEILSVIRHLCPHTIIAIISGHLPDQVPPDVVECADVVMRKPIDIQKFKILLTNANSIRQKHDIEAFRQRVIYRMQNTVVGGKTADKNPLDAVRM